ncbi:glutamate--cysteine ligase [Streptomyces fulvorobeus]|uniref:Glutamate--cysteine ligase n=1 Tax=Streptomyces fulvorobeus TaxID=284028 RepID=A0A7J0CGM7_9ACTN|nr:glutamate--cysteine ligase [Streptomyces fulvorobeus]
MGRDVGRVTFTEQDHVQFRARLEDCLSTLRKVLGEPEFGVVPASLGAELEVSLIGEDGGPAPVNVAVHKALQDDLITLEVARFNLEANLEPVPLRGRPFTAMAEQAAHQLRRITAQSLPHHGARAVPIGTLPTLTSADVTTEALTPVPRFHALEHAWARRRPTPFALRVAEGGEGVLRAESVAVQGAACSWQVHLTVAPDCFRHTFNAAQLATAPALAAAGNSPFPLGRRGGQEARIPLYEQGFGDRSGARPGAPRPRVGFGRAWLRGGPLAGFEEAVHAYDVLLPAHNRDPYDGDRGGAEYPSLEELRLHLSTVWSWNRPVYDPLGHLRIEFRALPSGPTPMDMAANTAFLVGLTLSLAAEGRDVAHCLPFTCAKANFYRAARDGLRASLWWPSPGSAPQEYEAGALVLKLLPQAREGLAMAGVDADEADTMLHLLHERVSTGRTGAWWQQKTLEVLSRRRETPRGEGAASPTDRTASTSEERTESLPGRETATSEPSTARAEQRSEAVPGETGNTGGAGRHPLGDLTVRYARLAESAAPVHTWNLPADPPWSQ